MIELKSNFLQGFDKVVGKDDLRPVMKNILIDEGCLVATDANVLVKIDLSVWGFEKEDKENLNGYLFDNEILKDLQSLKKGVYVSTSKGCLTVHRTNRNKLKSYDLILSDDFGRYPNYKAVFPKLSEKEVVRNFKVTPTFLNNVYNVYLKNVSKHVTELTITPYGRLKPLVIEDEKKLFYGMVMPVK